jgi:uncharacterized membrane protein
VSLSSVFLTTFLAAAVEVVEMVIIVVGVGSVRGWRSTWLGAGAGLAVLAVLVAALGTALTLVPVGALRLAVGSLLLVFGLQWLRKGISRVSANGFRGMGARSASAEGIPDHGVDWTAFVLSFKGVLLEGLEIALIVVSFGATAQAFPTAILGAAAGWCSASRAAPCSSWWECCCRASGPSGRWRGSESRGRAGTPRSSHWSGGTCSPLPGTSGV